MLRDESTEGQVMKWSEMEMIPIMGLGDVDDAMHHLRDAEITMAEFEKQLKWHFSLFGPARNFSRSR